MSSAPREVDYDDVDDIIGIAAEMQQLDADNLSVEELEAVARDLEIPEDNVKPAIVELRRRRAAALATERRQLKRKRIIIAAVSVVVAGFVLWTWIAGSGLSDSWYAVERHRAQVVNVMQRQQQVRTQFASAPDSEVKHAELSGSENRVRVERRKYDAAATRYNQAAASFPASLWRAVTGGAERAPLSSEVDGW